MEREMIALVVLIALGLLATAALDLGKSAWQTWAMAYQQKSVKRTNTKDATVDIQVTNDAGESVIIPLRPDSEESIRNFLRKAEAVAGG